MKFLIYDEETFPNCFVAGFILVDRNELYVFEMSDRRDQKQELLDFVNWAIREGYYFVGFNNVNFDCPILQSLLMSPFTFTYQKAHQMGNEIIHLGDQYPKIKPKDRLAKQIDLSKINHFDNRARRTSLKALQFAMRSESVEDLPFELRSLTDAEKDVLIYYNIHDLTETKKFFHLNLHLIMQRFAILESKMLYGDVLNYSDVKIGASFIVNEIGREKCYDSYGHPHQTRINSVHIKDVILPKIQFRDPDFQQVRDWFETKVWYKAKDAKDEELAVKGDFIIKGFHYFFGMGGIHGSVEKKVYETNDEYTIVDLDVAGMYPSIAIANNFYPMHLGISFVEKYAELRAKRNSFKKGTPENAMYKLAQNATFGNSNNSYSPLYDPSYLLKITINGQLQLLQLAEQLGSVPKVEIIQVNTDGITCYVHKSVRHFFDMHKEVWQKETGLDLEEVEYKKMWIRDVNNYLAQKKDGKLKRKGAYWYPETIKDYDGVWNKDFSMMVVPKAIEYVLVNGYHPEFVVRAMTDKFDFMLRYKTPGSAKVYIGDKQVNKTVRYYVSTKGQPMKKIASPKGILGAFKRKPGITDALYRKIMSEIPVGTWDERIHTKNKSTYAMTTTRIEEGWLVKQCNKASDFNWDDVDWKYYSQEVEKLII